MALIKDYFDLTQKYQTEYGEKTILLMQVGSFFEVYGLKNKESHVIYGSKICDFSNICDLNVVDKNASFKNGDSVLMAGFKDTHLDRYVKKIQEACFTCVVYTQDEASKNTTRSLAGIFSPGTYFSNDSVKLTNNVSCVWIDLVTNMLFSNKREKSVIIGVANLDIYTGKTCIFQYKESYLHNPTTYDGLERFISIYCPNETIIISNLPTKEVEDVLHFANIGNGLVHTVSLFDSNLKEEHPFTKRAICCEKQNYQREIFKKFYPTFDVGEHIYEFYENHIAYQAFCFLLDFVYQHNPYLVNKIAHPLVENCTERLLLANHSLKQLNMIEDDNGYSGKYSSVVKMLNECFTPMGKRNFSYQFLHPITNGDKLQKEYDIVEYVLQNDSLLTFLKVHLPEIKDISKWERQLFLKKITPKTFYNLHENLIQIKHIYENVVQDKVLTQYLENTVKNIDTYCTNLAECISSHLDFNVICKMDASDCNYIRAGVDKDLDFRTQQLHDSEAKLECVRSFLNGLIVDKGKTSDFIKIHETEKNNFALLCTSRRCKLLEESLPVIAKEIYLKYNVDNTEEKSFLYTVGKKRFEYCKQTSSNHSIEDNMILHLCKTISTIKVSLKDVVSLVFAKFVESFEKYQGELESIVQFITAVDVLCAKSIIAKKYNYCKPTILLEIEENNQKSFFKAKGLRHCLIEQIQTNEMYVANDVSLGDCESGVDGILLYGTNAVGKTSLIRSIGIAVIMAQAGLFVPCREFTFKPYRSIFTRILGNDNIFKGLSTFAVEMSELRTILRMADENSLILGDELCSGTENTSAISIFVAGIQRLHSCNSSFIFATHLHEIVDYEEIRTLESVVLKHMTVVYDRERDSLIYDRKLKDGSGDSMYGLEVCKSLSLPADFLEAAHRIRCKYHPAQGSMLSLKTSHFNKKKIMNLCEKCGENIGTEVHHLQHQKFADADGVIFSENGIIKKNSLANLTTLCENCHREFHTTKTQYKKVKSSTGYILQPI